MLSDRRIGPGGECAKRQLCFGTPAHSLEAPTACAGVSRSPLAAGQGGLKGGLWQRERTVILMLDELIVTETPPVVLRLWRGRSTSLCTHHRQSCKAPHSRCPHYYHGGVALTDYAGLRPSNPSLLSENDSCSLAGLADQLSLKIGAHPTPPRIVSPWLPY